jgi:hypothetical protein
MSFNEQEFPDYRGHVTNMRDDITGQEALEWLLDYTDRTNHEGQGRVDPPPFWFMYGARASDKQNPVNCELMICQPYHVWDNSGIDNSVRKYREMYVYFFAKRDWMWYPGIQPIDLPNDVERDHKMKLTLNDLRYGVDRGHIWICQENVTCDEEESDFIMPFKVIEGQTVDYTLESDE